MLASLPNPKLPRGSSTPGRPRAEHCTASQQAPRCSNSFPSSLGNSRRFKERMKENKIKGHFVFKTPPQLLFASSPEGAMPQRCQQSPATGMGTSMVPPEHSQAPSSANELVLISAWYF